MAFVLAVGAGLVPALAQEDAAPILMSRQLAEQEGLRIGDVVQLATDAAGTKSRPFRVVGIYEPTPDPMRLGTVPREV